MVDEFSCRGGKNLPFLTRGLQVDDLTQINGGGRKSRYGEAVDENFLSRKIDVRIRRDIYFLASCQTLCAGNCDKMHGIKNINNR